MFVVVLTYVRPLEEVDAQMKAHVTFLQGNLDAGRFLLAGRRRPRVGGVILANVEEEAEMREIMDSDPFVTSGVATYELIEFNPSMATGALSQFQRWPKR